jgi:abhydrolase domain-containing protein 12
MLMCCLENQVTPFSITTPDGQTLHAWHILPRTLYAKHEAELLEQKLEKDNDLMSTLAFKLLSEDPESKLVINCKCIELHSETTDKCSPRCKCNH